ncbi:hypothetical protein GBA65_14495 [Rubrobacter marinus]|uniref:ABC-type glycine betaine transport system substrate-binding domain-containing protein n=1 Tax=Rubrobacter marinus TaxID=2653852 RepID=A0A6G8PZ68_9ACTN|nr:glycine betaine ABC transporter substrate-binding protein [Rubrobacter marinus]QIN79529.1 hypothetical protein GBA65_14495 [Rubrobacter marinus]
MWIMPKFRALKLAAVAVALSVAALASGCGQSASPESTRLVLGYIGWDENVAVSNLTKLLLEEELGYEEVEMELTDPKAVFERVGDGEMDAFQDVWLPNHSEQLEAVEGDVELLRSWFRGQTKFSLAAPSYMGIDSIAEINETEATRIVGIEPETRIMERIPSEVVEAYDLEQDLVEGPTEGMLTEVERLYTAREPFIFVAWSPHWMNQRYEFEYLEDPKGALGALTQPSELHTIVREDLSSEDPVAYEFMNEVTLTEQQVNTLEDVINTTGDPVEGSRAWLEENREVVQPWVDAAKRAREA